MSADDRPASAASLAENFRGRLAPPWDLFVERTQRFEVHLAGDRIEMRRGPIELAGFGLRLFRPAGERIGIGHAASSDLSPESVQTAIENAEATATHAPSPATRIDLPSRSVPARSDLGLVDPRLWEKPESTIEAYAEELLAAVVDRRSVVPSFGSVRAALTEVSQANSSGASSAYPSTTVDLEFAVKAFGGPEGRPPGEYWINRRLRAVPQGGIREEVADWCRMAEDTRIATPTEAGITRVLFPPAVLADVLPEILGYRFSGQAVVRQMAPKPNDEVAAASIHVSDDGLHPGAVATAPVDDEGTPHGRTPLIAAGRYVGPLLDVVHGAAVGGPTSGNGQRYALALAPMARFMTTVQTLVNTLEVAPGSHGSDEELMERMGEGIWVEQLGYPFPDPATSAFGGEIRLGYRVRGGKRAEPIRGGTVGGFTLGPAPTPPLLASVTGLGSRSVVVGRLSAPTLLVEGFPVAGGT